MFDEDYKKLRLPNACNNCRLKKIKCDSAIQPQNICSNCIAYKTECVHNQAKKRGPRIGRRRSVQPVVEAILSTGRAFEVPKDPAVVKEILVELANHIKELEEDIIQLQQGIASTPSFNSAASSPPSLRNAETTAIHPHYPNDSELYRFRNVYSVDDLTQDLKMLEYDDNSIRHFGSSSNRTFVKTAMDIKKKYTGYAAPSFKRIEFWSVHPWQKNKPENPLPTFEFPPSDLMVDLFELYFTRLNPLLPILHRPSFLKSIAEDLHRKDHNFGGLVLAVCALGARFSNDPRVFEEHTSSERSIGWKWIRQIQPIRKSFDQLPSIYEIQLFVVYMMFVGSSTTPEVCWILISIGVRLLQDVGAHRKLPDNCKPSFKTESWKRAFWMLYSVDVLASTLLGRPRSMSPNDFDTELPIDCDDDYWDHPDPELAFKQPPGKPSTMSYWICFLKLTNIMGLTLHTIHGIKPSHMWSATVGLTKQEWNEKFVSELDSLLNKWIDEIPEHLKWDPNQENVQHFDQSVVLYTTYYWTQILVHRPFIPRPGDDSDSSIPSLAICANAARSCLHVLEIQQQRETNALTVPNVMIAMFHSSIVILMNMWRGKHFIGSSSHISKELAGVHRAIDALHLHENRWEQAGRFADVLMEIISVSHFQQSNKSRLSLKRSRIEDDNSSPFPTRPFQDADKERRRTAGNNRVLETLDVMDTPQSLTTHEALPLNSQELGSLPIYEPFNWSMPQGQWSPSSTDPWIVPVSNDMNQFGSYPSSSGTFTNFSSEDISLPPANTISPDPGDWASYMATIDEVLQATDPRMV